MNCRGSIAVKPMKSKAHQMCIHFTGWFGFWLFLTVYIVIEGVMYLQGHDTFFWAHKTPTELALQQKQSEQ